MATPKSPVRLTPFAKVLIAVFLIATVAISVKRWAPDLWRKVVPSAKERQSVVPTRADLPQGGDAASQGVAEAALPGSNAIRSDSPEARMLIWAWNAQMGLLYANGGAQTTDGSLMAKRGVNVKLIRQDDVSQMQNDLIKFAQELKRGTAQPKVGAHFVAIMGDGAAAFLAGVNNQLARIGPEYVAQVIGSCGYSRGEDKFMGLPEWKQNPQAARGALVAGVLRDGDWNIAMKWAGDNGIPNNPDEKTYDPDALNWVAADTYVDAAQKYVAGYAEERAVVSQGKRTGQRKRVTVNGVVTWTPGDVTVARERGGLVSIVSTKEYRYQMPNTIIGIKKWMQSNRTAVEEMLVAICEGGDQVKLYPRALSKAAEISAAVYNEETPEYWERYYRGTTETDKQGLAVELGGSSVNNVADNLYLFGLAPGSTNIFGATYTVFGNIVVQQYSNLVPSYPPLEEILDTSYIAEAAKNQPDGAKADVATFSAGAGLTRIISRRSWEVNFNSGQSSLTPWGERQLGALFQDLVIAGGTTVEIHGHTDNIGNPKSNRDLSEQRAFAVKRWLEARSSANFPEGRIRVFAHGDENPVAPNGTAEGRAKNRRVEVVLGTTS